MDMDVTQELAATAERLAAAASLLEHAAEKLAQHQTELAASAGNIERVVATVDSTRDRELDLEAKLAAAEQKIAALEARAAQPAPEPVSGRKTMPAALGLLAKHGLADGTQAAALDAALVHLSLEQRIAVKADLLRAGLVS